MGPHCGLERHKLLEGVKLYKHSAMKLFFHHIDKLPACAFSFPLKPMYKQVPLLTSFNNNLLNLFNPNFSSPFDYPPTPENVATTQEHQSFPRGGGVAKHGGGVILLYGITLTWRNDGVRLGWEGVSLGWGNGFQPR